MADAAHSTNPSRRSILSALPAAAATGAVLTPLFASQALASSPHLDADLLALMPETDRLIAELELSATIPDDEQDEAAVDNMHEQFTAQMLKISSIQATTLDGLKFKASLHEYDDVVQLSLVNDLLAL